MIARGRERMLLLIKMVAEKGDERTDGRTGGRVDDERERALYFRRGVLLSEVTYPWTVSCLEYGIKVIVVVSPYSLLGPTRMLSYR